MVPGNAGNPWSSTEEPVDADLYVLGTDDAVCSGQGDRLRGRGAPGLRPECRRWSARRLEAVDEGVAGGGRHPDRSARQLHDHRQAAAFLQALPGGYVVKTDYPAFGKGVLVTDDLDEAISDSRSKLEHGAVVIEERLEGLEFSVLAICDGEQAVMLPPAMDHKRIFDGDTGPNTGGMGAVSPVPRLSPTVVQQAFDRCVQPTLDALRSAASTIAACCTEGRSCSPRTAPRWSSGMPGGVIPRPRCCSRCSSQTPTS